MRQHRTRSGGLKGFVKAYRAALARWRARERHRGVSATAAVDERLVHGGSTARPRAASRHDEAGAAGHGAGAREFASDVL